MLQQTQAKRVVPVYRRFLETFPDPAAFARASPEEVVAAWGGLGYLRRARNLHRAARLIAGDGWPADLCSLPGVGQYTAAAVGAFAFGARVAAVDVNLRRVLSRWQGRLQTLAEARAHGSEAVDAARPGDWNQAMMDLGALLCRPRSPHCPRCPVSNWCRDPSIELPGRAQPPYPGSVRQARAAILKRLADGPAASRDLGRLLGLDPATVATATGALAAEGAIQRDGSLLRLS